MKKSIVRRLRWMQSFLAQRLHGTTTAYTTRNSVWTIPNLITGLGIIATVLYITAITVSTTHNAQTWWLPMLAACVILTDILDGVLADKLDQHSYIGKIIDPLRDRLLACALLLHVALLYPYFWMVISMVMVIAIEVRLAWLVALSANTEVHMVGKLRAGLQWMMLLGIIVLQTWFAVTSDTIAYVGVFLVILLSLLALRAYQQQNV